MINYRSIYRAAVLVLFFGLIAPTLASATSTNSWDFDVYLDNKKIGTHRFDVMQEGEQRRVTSTADFDYKLLFVSVYRYEHRAAERWQDNCLLSLDASTDVNGDEVNVSGSKDGSGFVVERNEARAELPDCVMTFAYWNPEFLKQPTLLNPQTGEYIDVQVDFVGTEQLAVRGQQVTATRYRLTAYETDLTLWYSADKEWLALESAAKGGRTIRYELS